MSSPDPVGALAAGVTVVTPNNRLARTLIARHDAAMVRAGKRAWSAARALPWSIWITTLWRDALEAGVAPPAMRVLGEAESRFLWQRIVGEDATLPSGLLDLGGAADTALDAWSLVHAWGSGGESWRAWRDASDQSDASMFARWAERYRRELEARSAFDLATLPDATRAWAHDVPAWHGRKTLLA